MLKFLGTSISESGEVFLVAEFMEHGSLRDLIYRAEGKVDWKLRVRLAIDAARGMEYLHSCHPPIIHRYIICVYFVRGLKHFVFKIRCFS